MKSLLCFMFLLLCSSSFASDRFFYDSVVVNNLPYGIISKKKYKDGILRNEVHYLEGKRIYIVKFRRNGKKKKHKISSPIFKLERQLSDKLGEPIMSPVVTIGVLFLQLFCVKSA